MKCNEMLDWVQNVSSQTNTTWFLKVKRILDEVFKNGPSKTWGRQLRQTILLQIF